MDTHEHHEELIDGIVAEQKEILENSAQAIYIYLDDSHKVCNGKFAKLLGYGSAEEWAKQDVSFTEEFVDEKSAQSLISAYQKSMEQNEASKIDVTWKKKDGTAVETSVIIAPIVSGGHLFAIHFISEK